MADISEWEDMILLKRNTTSSFSCHISLTKVASFNLNRTSKIWNFVVSSTLLKETSTGHLFAQQTIAEHSKLPLPSVLFRLPMVGIHSFVDTYPIFRFNPMLGLALGLKRSPDPDRKEQEFKDQHGHNNKFNKKEKHVIGFYQASS